MDDNKELNMDNLEKASGGDALAMRSSVQYRQTINKIRQEAEEDIRRAHMDETGQL